MSMYRRGIYIYMDNFLSWEKSHSEPLKKSTFSKWANKKCSPIAPPIKVSIVLQLKLLCTLPLFLHTPSRGHYLPLWKRGHWVGKSTKTCI